MNRLVSSKAGNWTRSFWIDLIGVFCLFFVYAGYSVPSVNEPHYWTKAAHFWDPDFGRGDLFLESGDAHWLFFATFGYLTQCMSLPAAVWSSRLLIWCFLAFSWTFLGRSLWLVQDLHESHPLENSPPTSSLSVCTPPLPATLWGAIWLAGMHWGQWAGEWVVGGSESKGVAFAAVFFAIAFAIQKRWTTAWIFLGIAAAFHVVIGIWVTACLVCVSFFLDYFFVPRGQLVPKLATSRAILAWFGMHQTGWLFCFAGVGIGAVPALMIDWGADPTVATESAVMQAYLRLGHHLIPTKFPMERWQGFGFQLVFALLFLIAMACSRISKSSYANQDQADIPKYLDNLFPTMRRDWLNAFFGLTRGMQLVFGCGCFAFLVAMIGLAVDWTLSVQHPAIAAKLLRFYWFRWNDVAMPMLVGSLAMLFASGFLAHQTHPVMMRSVAWFSILFPAVMLVAVRFDGAMRETIPAGDFANLVLKTDTQETQIKHYRDWVSVCNWIRNNTDSEGLWLTPRRQQSFKWHTGRAELACWKDMPQNAVALVNWGKRLSDAFQFDAQKKLMPWTEQKLQELRTKYGVRYVLLDKRVLRQGPIMLPMLYPTQAEANESFAVFEFPSVDSLPTNQPHTKPQD